MNNQMSSGMVFVFSLWGTGEGGMSWLDGTSGCSGPCTDMSEVTSTYSNITIS